MSSGWAFAMSGSWWAWLSVAQVLWVIGLSVWILFERRSPLATIAWIFGLSLLPIIGVVVYLLFGPRKFERKKLRHAVARQAAKVACEHPGDAVEHRLGPAQQLMTMCEAAAGPPARPRRAELRAFFAGEDKYAALVEAIEQAQHHVHMEYYIWEPDGIGTRLRDSLTARAREGVEVRVLIDGFGSAKAKERFWRPLVEAGGQVRRFNALTLHRWRPRLANFRSHRKIVVIDGKVGFVGGMNVTDVHSTEFSGDEAWRDTHVRICGPAVRGLQMVFFEGWHYATGGVPEGPAYLPPGEQLEQQGGHRVQVVCSGPDENLGAIHKLYVAAIASASRRVHLTTAYFVPDEPLLTALATAALAGADVRLLVPANNDLKVVGAASRSYYADLLEVGIRIYEYGPTMLHAKTLVVDDLVTIIGTANSDPRSFFLNFEVVLACYEPQVCDLMAQRSMADLDSATEITAETLQGYPFARRLAQNASRLLSPVL